MPAPPISRRKRKRQQNGATSQIPLLPPEIDEDDVEISDEDIEFVKQNKSFAGLLSGLDTKGITKQVLGLKPDWEGDDLEKFYEKKNEAASKKKPEQAVTVDPVDALPIKNLDGKLEYRKPIKEQEKSANDDKVSAPKPEKLKKKQKQEKKEKKATKDVEFETQPMISEEEKPVPKSEALEELKTVEEKRAEMRMKIAELCNGLMSDPEESMPALKELLAICWDKDDNISQLAMLSSMAIFRNILPGYRIRMPTEKELQMQVSKEVKKVRDYETALLKHYQAYIKILVKTTRNPAASSFSSLQLVALKCMCDLLEAVPDFNFRDTLLRTVIPFMNSTNAVCRKSPCNALRSIFKDERKHGGEGTVEAVQLIADFVKENDCNLQPDVLEVFLHLKFDEDITKAVKESRDGKGTEKKFKSKREEKIAQKKALAADLRTEVEDDFREASNLPDATQRRKLQTLSLSAVFETYFRVLKTALASLTDPDSEHPLLATCLKGLLKFSHLISMEFLGDLLAVLRKLAEGGLAVEERLHCCIAAFKIMKANMDALNVDLKDFNVQFYRILLELCPDRNKESECLFAEALEVVLCDSRQHDMQRVAAFIRRLGATSFHFESATAISALVAIRKLLVRYKQCRNMLENDGGGGGPGGANATVFQLDGSDPDVSGALSSVMWELSLLEKHYHPEVAKLSRQLSTMLASENVTTALSPKDAIAAYSTLGGGFRPAVKQPSSKINKKNRYSLADQTSSRSAATAAAEEEAAVDFRGYFRLLRDINENQVLRKEQLRGKSMLDMYERYRNEKKELKKTKRK